MKSQATTVEQYLAELPDDRKAVLTQLREIILKNLPEGYEEMVDFGMPAYVIPLSRYPKTYNKRPLMYVAFASQKNYMAIYMTAVYANKNMDEWFRDAYAKSGKKLDMGKGCVRFTKIEDLPLDVIGEAVKRVAPDMYINYIESLQTNRNK